jgi:PAS domain S-box-containing protein
MIKRFKSNDALTSRQTALAPSVDLLALLDLAPVLARDLQERILHWGHGAQSLYGFTTEEALGQISHQLLNTLFPRPIEELRASLLAEGRWNGELTRKRKDGSRIVVASEWVLQRGSDGKPCAILEVNQDITERKSAEREQATLAADLCRSRQALQHNYQRLSLHNAAAEKLLLMTDPERALASIYERMAEYFQIDGYFVFHLSPSGNELEYAACRAFVETKPSGVSRIPLGQGVAGKVALTRKPIILERVHESKDPELQDLRNLDVHAYACEPLVVGDRLLGTLSFASRRRDRFDPEDQEFFRTLANYVALAKERLRLLNELEQHANSLEGIVKERTAQLVEANSNLQTFAYSAAHDLRSPLRSIRSFAEIILEESAQLSPMAQDCLEKLVASTELLSGLLKDLLEYNRLSRSQFPLETVYLDLAVEKALGLIQDEIRVRNAQVSIQSPLPVVRGNMATVVLVITNLVSNALKFTSRGVQPKVRLWAEPSNGLIRLSVRDNGIGIRQEDQQKLFEPFKRLNSKTDYPGTGLGLAIVRRAVERMGGSVGVESEPGKGSRFWLELMGQPHE